MVRIKLFMHQIFQKKKKISIAPLDLAQETWQNSTFRLPNNELRDNVHKLDALFQKSVDCIAQENSHLNFKKSLWITLMLSHEVTIIIYQLLIR